MATQRIASSPPGSQSRSAELLLLALYATAFDLPVDTGELRRSAAAMAMSPEDIETGLRELGEAHLVEAHADEDTVRLTPPAVAHILELAEEFLPHEILSWRPLQEQAEALIIWRLAKQ